MNRSDETLFDPRIADWLEDDPHRRPTRRWTSSSPPSLRSSSGTHGACRGGIRACHRSPNSRPSRRPSLIVAVGGVYLLAPRPDDLLGGPPASASPGPSSRASGNDRAGPHQRITPVHAILDACGELWSTYESGQYGFSIGHPATGPSRRLSVPGTSTPTPPTTQPRHGRSHRADRRRPRRASGRCPSDPAPSSTRRTPRSKDGSRSTARKRASRVLQRDPGSSRRAVRRVQGLPSGPAPGVPDEWEVQAFFTGGHLRRPDGGRHDLARGELTRSLAPTAGVGRLLEAFIQTMGVIPNSPSHVMCEGEHGRLDGDRHQDTT